MSKTFAYICTQNEYTNRVITAVFRLVDRRTLSPVHTCTRLPENFARLPIRFEHSVKFACKNTTSKFLIFKSHSCVQMRRSTNLKTAVVKVQNSHACKQNILLATCPVNLLFFETSRYSSLDQLCIAHHRLSSDDIIVKSHDNVLVSCDLTTSPLCNAIHRP